MAWVIENEKKERSTATSPSVSLGFTATADRLLVVAISILDQSSITSPPSGYTLHFDYNGAAGEDDQHTYVYTRVSDGTETTISWTIDALRTYSIRVLEISGLRTSGYYDFATTTLVNSSGGKSCAIGTLTPSAAPALCLSFLASRAYTWWSAANTSVDNGFSVYGAQLAQNPTWAVATKSLSDTSAVGATTWTTTDTGNAVRGFQLVLLEDVAVGLSAPSVFFTEINATDTQQFDATCQTQSTVSDFSGWRIRLGPETTDTLLHQEVTADQDLTITGIDLGGHGAEPGSFYGNPNDRLYLTYYTSTPDESPPAGPLQVQQLDDTAPSVEGIKIVASDITSTSANLVITGATDDISINTQNGIQIYANGIAQGFSEDIGSPWNFVFLGDLGTTYEIQVRAYDVGGNSSGLSIATSLTLLNAELSSFAALELSRDMAPATYTRAVSNVVRPIGLAEFQFRSNITRVWTGVGDLWWGNKQFLGVGDLGAVSRIEENSDLRAAGVSVSLSGIPSGILRTALDPRDYRGQAAFLYWALLNEQFRLDQEPIQVWSGFMDTMTITEGATASIALVCENRLVELERRRTRRYTDADQQREFAGDRFFEFVPSLQDSVIRWG